MLPEYALTGSLVLEPGAPLPEAEACAHQKAHLVNCTLTKPNNELEFCPDQKEKEAAWFRRVQYVDTCNDVPSFLPGLLNRIKTETGQSWTGEKHEDSGPAFGAELINFLANDLNGGLSRLLQEFPEVRFTASIHGDERWLDIPVQFDCLDVHFYADIDSRWRDRTRFAEWLPADRFLRS